MKQQEGAHHQGMGGTEGREGKGGVEKAQQVETTWIPDMQMVVGAPRREPWKDGRVTRPHQAKGQEWAPRSRVGQVRSKQTGEGPSVLEPGKRMGSKRVTREAQDPDLEQESTRKEGRRQGKGQQEREFTWYRNTKIAPSQAQTKPE